MEDRQQRLLLAIVLSLGLWMGVNYFILPPPAKKNPAKTAEQSKEVKDAKDAKTVKNETKPAELKPLETPKGPTIKIVDPAEVKRYYITGNSFLVQFTSLGGRIEKFYVKNYLDREGSEVKIVKSEDEAIEFDGKKHKAIEVSRERGFDFNISGTKEEAPASIFNHLNFASNYNEATHTLTFEAVSPDEKFAVKKEFIFFPAENYFKYNMVIQNKTTGKLVLANPSNPMYFKAFGSLGPIKSGDLNDRDQMHHFRYFYINGSFNDNIDGVSTEGFGSKIKTFFTGEDPQKDKNFDIIMHKSGDLDFYGTGSRYFISALNPLTNKPAGVMLDNRKGNTTGVVALYDNISLEPNSSISFDHAAYVGIREADGMAFRDKNLDPSESKDSPFTGMSEKLDKSFNQGITTPLRNGIVWVFKKLAIVVPNYGWCIILFAILFKAAFYPLNQKQAESMKKMQELKPQIDAINLKYDKDPAVKQQKIMELYKKNNANPMGGCLPLVIQIPIFIALYTAFSDTIDLWKSPFLWINDLSEPDTVYMIPILGGIAINIMPLIMVGTQFVQTKMTSVSTDPSQKTMMYIMPVMMLYFFWSMPSGVTMYWTFQNVLSIAQQAWTNHRDSKKK